ncbi:MAG TPA: transketolase C-terminal domain-containing protein, partial [Vicinamibacterales bacterium]|nr:transketolase C-terminal domain-containing protein [Vicinamibacterales bacterium]
VLILGDGLIGQIMEPIEFDPDRKPCKALPPKTWATTGCAGDRPPNIITSLFLDPEPLAAHNEKLQAKYAAMARDEVRVSGRGLDEPYDVLVVAYGTVARACNMAITQLRESGVRAALLRPVSLFPFPAAAVRAAAARADAVLVVELSAGQMVEDVRAAVGDTCPVHFHGRTGGLMIPAEEVAEKVRALATGARLPSRAAEREVVDA